jgi:hypothetical protein
MSNANASSPYRRRSLATLVALGLTLLVATPSSVHARSAPGSDLSSVLAGAPPEPAPDEPVPAGSSADDPAGTEIVQSWALAPLATGSGGNRPELSYQASPGSTIDDKVVLYNLGNVPMEFRVYATDAFNNDDGQFDLLPGDELPTDVGSWVQLAADRVVVDPGQQATIPIRITIPADAAPGDHAGAIVASSIASADNGDGTVIDVERRTGTRLYIQVAGPLTPVLAITEVAADYPIAINPWSAPLEVRFRVENRGNVRLGGTPEVTVAGPFGLGRRTVSLPEMAELLPGESTEITGLVGAPALLFLTTTVRIDPVGAASVGDVESAQGSARVFAPPLVVLLVALAIIFGLLAVRAYRRHRPLELEPELTDERVREVSSR